MVVINMQLPESCYDCPMVYDNEYCCVPGGPFFHDMEYKKKYPQFDFCHSRHPECPMHPARWRNRNTLYVTDISKED